LEEIEVSGRILLKRVIKFDLELVKWIGVSQDGDSGIASVNMVMNICSTKVGGNFLTI